MSDGGYYVNTRDKQLELANLLAGIDRTLESVKSRQSKIESASTSIVEADPPRIIDLQRNPYPMLGQSRRWKISQTPSLVRPLPSQASLELQKSIETTTISTSMIKQERVLPDEVKAKLAEVRRLTIDTIKSLLRGEAVGGVKLIGFRLLKQDGNVFEVESLVQEGNKSVKVQSKVCVLENGSAVIYQDSHYAGTTCDKTAKQFAGTVDLALAKAYVNHFTLPLSNVQRLNYRKSADAVYIGGERVTLEKSMCG